ncbi:sulfurtransferase TusA family protein [Desulfuromonas thiophila]|uniref:Sulfurtransferase TusA n=1 Tax=Desulfuromonas thiophila TaxID=57664 RepID=A0A1G7DCR0_9BACT|nr:sulfurtransferase TusA family protein [Desulfuromonas thiophila]MCK9172827.1 sulfurtransferase TusA family protein [Desulfuromonas thiophila]MDD3802200.1 sulfurtransferase TusA family protein [Desulfuromonas thiophila]MDY0398040.1 sulfurtransferase TusA family protein [Desulfuromonas thiophila]SDE49303.1 Sulfurtransferase TusA [Desulfuromonas thiophila]
MEIREFDICGQVCPSALLTALREVNRHRQALREGRLMLVLYLDAREATHTIPEAVGNMGYAVSVEPCPRGYCLRIGRG